MSSREYVALGTSSQVPTRERAHHGGLLRWDNELVLLDPGEGTQRQLTLAGISTAGITRICITHLHGDHCLGLPGVLQRMALDGVARPVDLYYPASGQEYVDRLRRASVFYEAVDVREHPVASDGAVDAWPGVELRAAALDHRVETYGRRLQEPDGRRMLPDKLAERGIVGPDVGRLLREGLLMTRHGLVNLGEVSENRPGQSFAFIMDTRACDGATELARGADLVVCESTYLSSENGLAHAHGHLTAAQAAQLAARSGSRRLVLTHFSQRHRDEQAFAQEARQHFSDVYAVRDLDRVTVPQRIH